MEDRRAFIPILLWILCDYGIAVYNAFNYLFYYDTEEDKDENWPLFSSYVFINIPLWVAPFPFIMYVLKRWPDTYETRNSLRRTCTMVNMKQLVGIIFLLLARYAFSEIDSHTFWNKMIGQIGFFCVYSYLQGLLNNFARNLQHDLDDENANALPEKKPIDGNQISYE